MDFVILFAVALLCYLGGILIGKLTYEPIKLGTPEYIPFESDYATKNKHILRIMHKFLFENNDFDSFLRYLPTNLAPQKLVSVAIVISTEEGLRTGKHEIVAFKRLKKDA